MKAKLLLQTLPLWILCASLAAFVTSCGTVAETQRSQLLLITPSQELQLGLTEFDKLKKSTPISRDARANEMLQRVGRRIAAQAKLANAQWEFVLFDQPKVANAFCLPGGKVGVFTGIFPITQNEAGLATVIGHEVAHAVARHGAERVSEGLLVEMGGKLLDQAMQENSATVRGIVLKGYGLGGQVGVMLPHSRKHELEADHIGLLYMARAGYDPNEAVAFWKRFGAYTQQQGGKQTTVFGVNINEFLSTHPVDSTRVAQLEQLMPKAMAEYQKGPGR